jgi:tRNA(Ile)-lysidine synthase
MRTTSGDDDTGAPGASLDAAVATLPLPGRWAVGVSGGADSVALLELLVRLVRRSGTSLTVAHLDHETRAGSSAADAAFVRELAARHGLPCAAARRSEIEPAMHDLPANRSSRFRLIRLEFFRRVIAAERLDGVVLAHHADDLAETVIQRLLRGSGSAGLTGMRGDSVVSGLRIVRPLLGVRRAALRAFLVAQGVAWREDASNASVDQLRNRVRVLLASRPALTEALLEVARTSAAQMAWLRSHAPEWGDVFDLIELRGLPPPVAREAARQWLSARAGPGEEIPPAAADRLVEMATDAASPGRQHFPGNVLVRRRGGKIFVDRDAT